MEAQHILDHLLEGIQILDFDWHYVYVNPAQEKYSRYPKEQLLGFTIMEKYPDIERSELFKVMTKCMNERTVHHLETENIFPDGTIGYFEMCIQPVPEGIIIMSIDITQRKIAEEEQKKTARYYTSLIEQALDTIYIVDSSDPPRIIDINRSGCDLLGYSKEEILKLTTHDIIFESEIAASSARIARIREGNALRGERKLKKKDGRAIDVEFTARKMEDGNLIVIVRDISERKAAELKLARSEMRFRALVENSKDVIALLDEKFNTIYRSPSATRILGWTEEEFKVTSVRQIHLDEEGIVQQAMLDLMKNPYKSVKLKFRQRHKDGHYIWLEGVAVNLLGDQYVNAIVFNFSDVTEQMAAEEKLKLSELYYRSIIEQASEAIYIADSAHDGNYTDINPTGVKMFGYTKDEFLKLRPSDLMFEEDLLANPLERDDLQTGVEMRCERRLKRKDGTGVETECVGKLLDDGKVLVVVRDITERKKAERELQALNETLEVRVKERTQELESFSYSVSHDLRAPLRAVNGYAQMLAEDYDSQLDDEGKRIIQTIRKNAVRMGMLIDDLLAFSRLGRAGVQKAEVELHGLVEGVIIEVNKSVENSAEIKIGKLHSVQADYSLMSQVIFNLVSNAIKYSSKKERPVVELFSEEKNGEVTFSVKDNGVGFDMAYSDKLFGVFQRLHSQDEFEGTGVGLAIVQRIIYKHGGTVWAVSKPDEGATFSFKLPNN